MRYAMFYVIFYGVIITTRLCLFICGGRLVGIARCPSTFVLAAKKYRRYFHWRSTEKGASYHTHTARSPFGVRLIKGNAQRSQIRSGILKPPPVLKTICVIEQSDEQLDGGGSVVAAAGNRRFFMPGGLKFKSEFRFYAIYATISALSEFGGDNRLILEAYVLQLLRINLRLLVRTAYSTTVYVTSTQTQTRLNVIQNSIHPPMAIGRILDSACVIIFGSCYKTSIWTTYQK
jgi:hypothetical protein